MLLSILIASLVRASVSPNIEAVSVHVIVQPISLIHDLLAQIQKSALSLKLILVKLPLVDVTVSKLHHPTRLLQAISKVSLIDEPVAPSFNSVSMHLIIFPVSIVCVLNFILFAFLLLFF